MKQPSTEGVSSEQVAIKTPPGADFDRAQLVAWVESAEESISKRLKGLRPKTPLVENPVFLFLFSQMLRRRLLAIERSDIFWLEYIKHILNETPLVSSVAAEGMVWYFLIAPQDAPQWKPRRSLKILLPFIPLWILILNNILNFLIFPHWRGSRTGSPFSWNSIVPAWNWFKNPAHFPHFLLASAVVVFTLWQARRYFARKTSTSSLLFNPMTGACSAARMALAKQMGLAHQIGEGINNILGLGALLIIIFGGCALGIFGGVISYNITSALYGANSWQMIFWGVFSTAYVGALAICLLMIACKWYQKEISDSHSNEEASLESVTFFVSAWRAPEKDDSELEPWPAPLGNILTLAEQNRLERDGFSTTKSAKLSARSILRRRQLRGKRRLPPLSPLRAKGLVRQGWKLGRRARKP